MRRDVGAVCMREVVIAEGHESLPDLARLMRHHHVGDVVIVRREGAKNFPIGVVTDRDIVLDALVTAFEDISTIASLTELLASDLVSRPVVTVRERDTIDDAVETMRRHGVRRVPVVDGEGALIGILAVDDLIVLTSDRLSELSILFTRQQRIEQDTRP